MCSSVCHLRHRHSCEFSSVRFFLLSSPLLTLTATDYCRSKFASFSLLFCLSLIDFIFTYTSPFLKAVAGSFQSFLIKSPRAPHVTRLENSGKHPVLASELEPNPKHSDCTYETMWLVNTILTLLVYGPVWIEMRCWSIANTLADVFITIYDRSGCFGITDIFETSWKC